MDISRSARILLIANPRARRNAPRLISDLRAATPSTYEWTIVETRANQFTYGELSDLARDSDLAIAVGGDGTVTDALTGIGDVDLPLAILPGGSTNVIAKEL